MEKPSKRFVCFLVLSGFLLAILEPLILLILGDDLGGAFWPMAKRSLDWTYFLRKNRTIIFAFFLLALPFSYYRSSKAGGLEKSIMILFVGFIFGLLATFHLLDWAYYRGAFLLLPTTYGFLLLCSALVIRGLPEIPFNSSEYRIQKISHIFVVLISVWLISPGLSSIAGLAPSPPELQIQDGKYRVETKSYQYPMPKEVSSIQGDYEKDVVFSVYITLPEDYNDVMPLAILLHGFANPFFESYTDWAEELASRGIAVAFIQYPSDVMPPGHDTFELHEESGMSNHPYHLPRAVAINASLEFMLTLLPDNVNHDYLMVAGHSLGAGYSFLVLEWALEKKWGNEALFVSLESPYARPVQEHLQFDSTKLPDNFLAHVAISEDDMSVHECFGVHHQNKLGDSALLIEVPSDRHGFPRLVASHYLQATEAHDDLADWGFYRRVASQANWLVSNALNDTINETKWRTEIVDSENLRYMGKWSDGKNVKPLRTWDDALNSNRFSYCNEWSGP